MRDRQLSLAIAAPGCAVLVIFVFGAIVLITLFYIGSSTYPVVAGTANAVYATNTAVQQLIEGTQTAMTATAQAKR